ALVIARVTQDLRFGLTHFDAALTILRLERCQISARSLYVTLLCQHGRDPQGRDPGALPVGDFAVTRDRLVVALGLLGDLSQIERDRAGIGACASKLFEHPLRSR